MSRRDEIEARLDGVRETDKHNAWFLVGDQVICSAYDVASDPYEHPPAPGSWENIGEFIANAPRDLAWCLSEIERLSRVPQSSEERPEEENG